MADTKDKQTSYTIFWGVLLTALAVRLALFAVVVPNEERAVTSDSRQYLALGADLRTGYHDPGADLAAMGLIRTSGYPVLIAMLRAILGPQLSWLLLVQVLLSTLTVYLVYRVGLAILHPAAAVWAAAFAALDGGLIIHGCYVLAETLFVFLLMLAMGLLVMAGARTAMQPSNATTGRMYALTGLAALTLGAATLTRPIAIFLPLVLALCILGLYRQRPLHRVAAALLLIVVANIPVAWRLAHNHATHGAMVFTTTSAKDLLFYRAAGAMAHETQAPLEVAQEMLGMALRQRMDNESIHAVSPAQREIHESRMATTLALETLAKHPRGLVMSTLDSWFRLLAGPGKRSLLQLLGWERAPGLVAAQVAQLALLYLAAIWGVVALARQRRYAPLTLLALVVLYFFLLSAGPQAYARFRVPMTPFLALLAGAGVHAVCACLGRKPTKVESSTDNC